MREPPGPCGAGRLRCVCWAGPLCVPVAAARRVACCPDRFPAAAWPVVLGLAAVCAGGRRPAREIATREPGGSEWSISRPALALLPPTGTAARPCKPPQAPRRPPIGRCSLSVRCRPGPATAHRHRGLALLPPTGTAARPCKPPQAPRRPPIGRCSLSVRCRPGPATAHRHRGLALPPPINFACNSPTTLSNLEFTTLELQRFRTLLKLHPIELHATFA